MFVGVVSAADTYNDTDDTVMTMESEEIDNLEASTEVDELEKVDEKTSDEVLSEGNVTINNPTVTVDDIEFDSTGNMSIPFHIANSDGTPISGGVIVSFANENNILVKYVELTNGSGKINLNLSEISGVMSLNTEELKDIYTSIISSVDPKNANVVKIIEGFKEITNGFSFNFLDALESINNIISNNYVNTTKFNNGIKLIEDSFTINTTTIKEGYDEIVNGFYINFTAIKEGYEEIINGINFNVSDIFNTSDFIKTNLNLSDDNLLNTVIKGLYLNKQEFKDSIDTILSELNITRDNINSYMSYLNFTSETQNKINSILNAENLTLTFIGETFKDITAYNITANKLIDGVFNVTDGFNFNILKTNTTNITNAFNKIFKTIDLDYNVVLNSIIKNIDFDSFSVKNLFKINTTKISNLVNGLFNISKSITINTTYLSSGMEIILKELNQSSVNGILKEIDFSNTTSAFNEILNDLNITPANILGTVFNLASQLNLNFTDKFTDFITDLILGKQFNMTKFITAVNDFNDNNNITVYDFVAGLDNVTGGYLTNTSKITQKINESNITNHSIKFLKSISLDFSKIYTKLINITDNINMTKVLDGLKTMLNVFDFNNTYINNTLNDILHEFNFNKTAFDNVFDKIIQEINKTTSTIKSGLDKIYSGFNFNSTNITNALNKIIGSLKINESGVSEGKQMISDSFKIDTSSILGNLSNIVNSFTFNGLAALNGINKIINGLGLNTSNIISQILAKFGTGGLLSYTLVENKTYSFDIKTLTQIDANDVSTTYGNSNNILISLKDLSSNVLAGKEVQVTLNGKTYTGTTNDKGEVSITTSKLSPKTYTASISFAGDETYAKSTQTVKVTVSKLAAKITAKKKTFKKSTKTKKYQITLKSSSGKSIKNAKVTLKVNSKTYKAKTNKNGKATFKITKLGKGTYKAVVKYAGGTYYNKATKSVNIAVK